MKKGKYLLTLFYISVFALFSSGLKSSEPVEDLEIINGVGCDIEKNISGGVMYDVPMSVYLFKNDNDIESEVRTGRAYTLGRTREERQLIEDKQNMLGLEKVYIFSEEEAAYGLTPYLEILLRNPSANDSGYVAVCSGKAYDILKFPMKGYPSSSDYIEGLLKNSWFQNFYSRNSKMSNIYIMVSAEGVNAVMPYIQEKDKKISVRGMVVFNKDKMAAKLDMEDTKFLNILREEAGQGILTIAKNPKENLDFYSSVKRKVKVSRQDGRYKYTIDLKFKGDVIYNQQYKNFLTDPNETKIIEGELERSIHDKCIKFIKKAQENYKVDCLNLGSYAAAKYGRGTGTDWNEAFINADIEVNVKVKVERTGRAQY